MQARKKIRPGRIELAKDEDALDVHFETQELAAGQDGKERVQNTKHGIKRLRFQLSPGVGIRQIAEELVASHKLIHPIKLGEVEYLVKQAADRQLLQRRIQNPAEAAQLRLYDEADREHLWQMQEAYMHHAHPSGTGAAPATMQQLEVYIEALYEEDMESKVAATRAILQLFRDGQNLEDLTRHPTLLQTLARMLRDEFKRSSELCINLVSVFFTLSHFAQLHLLLVQNQVGSMTMEILDLELRRCKHWEERDGFKAADVCGKQLRGVMLNSSEERLAGLLSRQEPLLYISTHLLLNMAEDQAVEQKMLRKGLLFYLVTLLGRSNSELLVLVTTFLRKLSIYVENKQRFAEAGVVARLADLVSYDGEALLASVLRLLHNLAFDEELRLQMVNCGMIPKAVGLIQREALQPLVLGLLYHLSMEDKYRSMFLYTDALPQLHRMALSCQGGLQQHPELAALVVNLTQNGRVAEELARMGAVRALLQNGLREHDPLVWKALRNLSQHDSAVVRAEFAPSMAALATLLQESQSSPDLFLELLGCLASLDIPGFDYAQLLGATQLTTLLARLARAASTPDDVLLEVVMATGVLCREGTAAALVEAGLVDSLYQVMLQRMDDEEFVLQTTATSYQLLLCQPTRAALLAHPEVVARFTELLQHGNREVCRAADRALDAISDLSTEWEASIRRLKFEQHNREWLGWTAAGLELEGSVGKGVAQAGGGGPRGVGVGGGQRADVSMVAGMHLFDPSSFAGGGGVLV